jgi:hypothetical protein
MDEKPPVTGRRKRLHTAASLVALACAFSAGAAETFKVPLHGTVFAAIDVPESWSVEERTSDGTTTIRMTPKEGDAFVVLLTIVPLPDDTPVSTPQGLKKVLTERGTAELAGALQEKLELFEVKAAGGVGYLYHLTDRNPEPGPGHYREARQGAFLLKSYFAAATLLTHPGDEASVKEGIAAMKTLRIEQ